MAYRAQNNFGFIRLVAALLVVLGHCYYLLWIPGLGYLADIAVNVFFIMSGYLITKSWLNDPSLKRFIKKRIIRIFPLLILTVVLTIFVVGPLNTNLPLTGYFSNLTTYTYLKDAMLLLPLQHTLPGVFTTNITVGLVNHSLWTLPVELVFYGLLIVVYYGRKINLGLMLLGISLALMLFDHWALHQGFYYPLTIFDFGLYRIIECAIYFALGAAAFVYDTKIRCSYPILIALLVVYIVAYLNSWRIPQYLSLTYFTLNIAFVLPSRLSAFTKWGDPSYVIYLWAFPLQQTLIHFYPNIQPLALFCYTAVPLLLAGFMVWKYIEAPLLQIKNRSRIL